VVGEEVEKKLCSFLKTSEHGWYIDPISQTNLTLVRLSSPPILKRSQWQEITLLETDDLGLCLVLDGRLQLAEADEFIYHEMLIHPAGLILDGPSRALILGGGDGCAARELLRYPNLEQIDLIDVDQEVILLARDKLNRVNKNSLEHPKVKIQISEANHFLQATSETDWDLIVADLTDPFDCLGQTSPLTDALFTPGFYDQLKKRLKPNGVLVIQTGGLSLRDQPKRLLQRLTRTINRVFADLCLACAFIPSFDEVWTVTLASDRKLDPLTINVADRLERLGLNGLRFYNPTTHLSIFHPPIEV
jgi:spermidine synthase